MTVSSTASFDLGVGRPVHGKPVDALPVRVAAAPAPVSAHGVAYSCTGRAPVVQVAAASPSHGVASQLQRAYSCRGLTAAGYKLHCVSSRAAHCLSPRVVTALPTRPSGAPVVTAAVCPLPVFTCCSLPSPVWPRPDLIQLCPLPMRPTACNLHRGPAAAVYSRRSARPYRPALRGLQLQTCPALCSCEPRCKTQCSLYPAAVSPLQL